MPLTKSIFPMIVGFAVVLIGQVATAESIPNLLTVPDKQLDAPVNAKVETVAERYPTGSIKIERQVMQDAVGNYVNHGTYTMFDPDGQVIKTGEFRNGKQYGKWTQHFEKDEGHLFSSGKESGFVGPFVSEAIFDDGQLHGTWTIQDANGQKVFEWQFDYGVRNGKSTWWHVNAEKRLEAFYKDGVLNGEVLEWDREGKQASQASYIEGRCLTGVVGWYALGQKRFEGYYLRVPNISEPTYDWWTTSAADASAAPAGKDQKHGVWVEWYRNGNKKTEGQYDHDLPVGTFTWWYENGQKQAEGQYHTGMKTGTWITWYPNGLKASQGEYRDGNLVSKWTRWDADGKVAEVQDFDTARPQQARSQSSQSSQNTQKERTGTSTGSSRTPASSKTSATTPSKPAKVATVPQRSTYPRPINGRSDW